MTMYINIWHDLKTNEDYIFEQPVSKTLDDAIERCKDEESYADTYLHTLKVEGGTVEKIDLSEHLDEDEDEDNYIGGKKSVEENDEHKTLCAKFLNKGQI